ncbi:Metal dependent phosphohydrolase [Seminavis robusta]|uniref:Metal dependent phosphohydrolase n=1 Tax=Seminavis robusta TaxID=568900 RepID=A0A9N8HWX4_9STRA|nr:Metal dependent phosphohydrolase [Seminavis robusta]|eukprot:Sro2829_g338100.1 Metal dependent phosphohydrolase (849) ;mRNA; r:6393-8939
MSFPSHHSYLLFLLIVVIHIHVGSSFNFEIERRVMDAIEAFFGVPEDMVLILKEYRANGGFAKDLQASDRDTFGAIAHSIRQVSHVDMIYYGAEDGVFMGYNIAGWGTYREPGSSGYSFPSDVVTPENTTASTTAMLYRNTCVDRISGTPAVCAQQPNTPYIQCDNCKALELCPIVANDDPAATGTASGRTRENGEEQEEMWCYQYDIVNTSTSSLITGYIPRTYHCHDIQGQFSQTPGMIVQPDGSLGDCLYADRSTRVNRNIVGNFAYCEDSDNDCRKTFVGGYDNVDYDPRYRVWYRTTKELQRPIWSQPYPFFSSGKLGLTYSHPIYTHNDDGRKIFQGAMGVDYTFSDLNAFLNASYSNANSIVVIYEQSAPHYLVASSPGFQAAVKVSKSGMMNSPCPYEDDDVRQQQHCTITRRSVTDVDAVNDGLEARLVQAAYQSQVNANYPRGLVSVDDLTPEGTATQQAYASQSSFYSAEGDKNLDWVILVISPVTRSTTDAVKSEDSLFGIVCAIAGLGFVLCVLMLVSFLSQRKSRAIILADILFTSAFLTGCALTNLSSLTYLGDNTQTLCIVRMWCFHFLFACALSPLLVKVYRIYRLVGSTERNPSIISSTVAFAMTLPIILVQVAILTIFTVVSPPQPEDFILIVAEEDGGSVTQVVQCQHESPAFYITILTFEFALVLIGCGLALRARKVDPGFGQATELLLSMFNIAFIGIGITIITVAMNVDQQAQVVLFTMGVFWGTVYSSAVFVVPRFLQARQDVQQRRSARTPAPAVSEEAPDQDFQVIQTEARPSPPVVLSEDTGDNRGYNPSRRLSDNEDTGWSEFEHDDGVALGTRSTTSQI